MTKDKLIFGIDISKDCFDVCDSAGNHYQFENGLKGFRSFHKELVAGSHCVMEATGYYHYRLAEFLHQKGVTVSVENPLSIKRFIQMKLSRIKTDKSDARMICLYGQERPVEPWNPYTPKQVECFQLLRLLDTYTRKSTSVRNKMHAQEVLGNPSKTVNASLKRTLKYLTAEMSSIEKTLVDLVKEEHSELLTKIESIPGIGRKTAVMLIVQTDGLSRFENAAQLCSFCGLTPVIRQSGSSVKGRARISKIGNAKLRHLLFMCSFTACEHNKACREMYQRMVANGKSKKAALIAVCNKLLKQAFAIAKSGIEYNSEHRGRLLKLN